MQTKKQSRQQKSKAQPQTIVVAQPAQGSQKRQSRRNRRRQGGAFKQVLQVGGASLAGLLGLPPQLGSSIGAGISRIFGQGDYQTNSPMQNSLFAGGPPAFSPLTSGVRVKHREFIRDVTSSVSFSSLTFQLNPGLNSTFPWLSSMAVNFEEYKIHGMVVYLNTTSASSVGSTNTALGLWGVVTQYDPSEPDFTTKQQAENYVGCQSATPSQSLLHGIECKPNSNILERMYVRTGDVGSEDLKFYDWGKIQIFTQGMQAVSTIGEMWVSYDIEFFKPRLPTGGYIDFTDRYYTLGCTSTLPLGSGTKVPYAGSTIGTSCVNGNRLVFPASTPTGNYLVMMKYTADNSGAFILPGTSYSGSVVRGVACFDGNSADYSFAPQNGTSNRFAFFAQLVRKTAPTSGYVEFTGATLPTGSSALDLWVMRVTMPVTSEKPNLAKLSSDELNQVRTLLNSLQTSDLAKLLSLIKPAPPEKVEEEPKKLPLPKIDPETGEAVHEIGTEK